MFLLGFANWDAVSRKRTQRAGLIVRGPLFSQEYYLFGPFCQLKDKALIIHFFLQKNGS